MRPAPGSPRTAEPCSDIAVAQSVCAYRGRMAPAVDRGEGWIPRRGGDDPERPALTEGESMPRSRGRGYCVGSALHWAPPLAWHA